MGAEIQKIFNQIKNATTPEAKSAILNNAENQRMLHAFGDSYAHVDKNGYFYKPQLGHGLDSAQSSLPFFGGSDPDNPAYHKEQYQDYVTALFNSARKVTDYTKNAASINWIKNSVTSTADEDRQKELLSNAIATMPNGSDKEMVNSPVGECKLCGTAGVSVKRHINRILGVKQPVIRNPRAR